MQVMFHIMSTDSLMEKHAMKGDLKFVGMEVHGVLSQAVTGLQEKHQLPAVLLGFQHLHYHQISPMKLLNREQDQIIFMLMSAQVMKHRLLIATDLLNGTVTYGTTTIAVMLAFIVYQVSEFSIKLISDI